MIDHPGWSLLWKPRHHIGYFFLARLIDVLVSECPLWANQAWAAYLVMLFVFWWWLSVLIWASNLCYRSSGSFYKVFGRNTAQTSSNFFPNKGAFPPKHSLSLSSAIASATRERHNLVEGASPPTHFNTIAFLASINKNWTVSLCGPKTPGMNPGIQSSGLGRSVCPTTRPISLHTARQNASISSHSQRQW